MNRILIIHTGGTISMLENKETGTVNVTDEHPLTQLKEAYHTIADVEERFIFDLPSPHITPLHMLQLSKEVNQALPEYDGIVITHGTDTLEETAYFLDLVLDNEKPVILTGAMRSSNEIGSDALYNLISSLRTACCEEAKGKGVLVVMNDEIHTAANVTKTSTSNVATFQSPQFGPIGIVTKDLIIFHHSIIRREFYPVSQVSSRVFLLKAFSGMDGTMVKALQAANPDGLVVEAFGQGNLPPPAAEAIKQMVSEDIPVVLVSRSYQGMVQPTYGYAGGGKQLKEAGVIFANGLTGPKARLKLVIALEKAETHEELRRFFD